VSVQKTEISDEELKDVCEQFIADGNTVTSLIHWMVAGRISCGDVRVRKAWRECGGPINRIRPTKSTKGL